VVAIVKSIEALDTDIPCMMLLQKDAETKMKKSVDSVENNLKAIRTGRAS
jgi:hypothetical protein